MRFACLDDWLNWQTSHHPSAIDLGLARVAEVATRLGLQQAAARARVLTIAGTNGKGSAVATLESLMLTLDQSVGAYTSPHLHRYNERIRVNGIEADDGLICRAFDAIDQAAGDISLTYFEFGTLAALWIFAQLNLSVWVLEVGLGGRLDAVNIVDPDAALVTSIGLDHQDWLGDDLEAIGREKAGIFRPEQLAIYMDAEPVASVRAVADTLGTSLWVAGTELALIEQGERILVKAPDIALTIARPALPLPSVVGACLLAHRLGYALPQSWLEETLPALQLSGRHQRVQINGRTLLLDVAHNPAACRFFLQKAGQAQGTAAGTQIVLAMMADKDTEAVLSVLATAGRVQLHLAALPDNPRAAAPGQLAAQAQGLGFAQIQSHASVAEALNACLRDPAATGDIWVLGSFFTVAAAQDWLHNSGVRS